MAIQLAHNAITGADDLTILKDLYDGLTDLTMKAYSGINEEALYGYKAMDIGTISEDDITLDELVFFFADRNVRYVDGVLEMLEKKGIEEGKHSLIFGSETEFIGVMTRVKKAFGIKNRSVALLKMCQICVEQLTIIEQEKQSEEEASGKKE